MYMCLRPQKWACRKDLKAPPAKFQENSLPAKKNMQIQNLVGSSITSRPTKKSPGTKL